MVLRRLLLVLGVVACAPAPPPPTVCSPSTCAGCCDSMGRCQDGTATNACGRLGLSCSTCQGSQSCSAGLCQGSSLGGGVATGGGSAGGEAAGGTAGSGGGNATAGGNVGGGSGGGTAAPARRYRSTPDRFAVPGPAYGALRGGGTLMLSWNTLDLTGDGRVDLAVTSDSLGGILLNQRAPVWNVFAGALNGFAAASVPFATPGSTTMQPLTVTDSASGQDFWNVIDVTGDGVADFVQTMGAVGGVSGPYFPNVTSTTDGWLVRAGSRSGFSTTMTTFSVPIITGRIDRTFADLTRRRWALASLNGDRFPDLVITADPQTDAVWSAAAGSAEWLICAGSATGFPDLARCTRTAIPPSGNANGFRSTSSLAPGQGLVWLLTDLNGDGLDDLVQTMNPSTIGSAFGNANAAFWKVWLNSGSSFQMTPTSWPVPGLTYAIPESSAAPQLWSLVDLDGDRLKDLVLTTAPNTGRPFMTNNVPSWQVYLGTARGFSSTPTTWPVPIGGGVDGFRSTAGPTWGLLDLTFDGVPDLVEFGSDPLLRRAFTDAQGAFWRVYPATP